MSAAAPDLKHFYRDEDGFFYCSECGKDLDFVCIAGHGRGCPYGRSPTEDAFAAVGMCAGCGRDSGHETWCAKNEAAP